MSDVASVVSIPSELKVSSTKQKEKDGETPCPGRPSYLCSNGPLCALACTVSWSEHGMYPSRQMQKGGLSAMS